jgi:hypothetical protein
MSQIPFSHIDTRQKNKKIKPARNKMNAQQVFGFVTYDKTAPLSLIFVIKKKGVATTLNFRSTNKKLSFLMACIAWLQLQTKDAAIML